MMKVLSLFDGMSCGQIALDRAGIPVESYFASEIDKYAIKVTQANYPQTIQLGDVTKVKGSDLPGIDLLIGGSPCQGFSSAGSGLNFEDPRSKLFFEFVRLKNETSPKYWLLENVKMQAQHQDIISEILGVKPILINSALVSAQNRERLYWTNIPMAEMPTDKGILLKDIVEIGEPIKDKSQTILATLYKENAKSMIKRNKAGLLVKMSSENPRIKELSITDRGIRPHRNDKRKSGISEIGTIHYPDTKSYAITAAHAPKVLTELIGWRKLSPIECERLQTVPSIKSNIIFDLCYDQARNYVDVVSQNPKLQKLVLSAEKSELSGLVSSAWLSMKQDFKKTKRIALQDVGTQIPNRTKSYTSHNPLEDNTTAFSAANAAIDNSRKLRVGIVPQNVFISITEGRITHFGRVESPPNAHLSTQREHGKKPLKISGSEIKQAVEDVEKNLSIKKDSNFTSITLRHLSTKNLERVLIIYYLFAKNVIAGYIQDGIQARNISINFSLEHGYTECVSNTQRYRMLGNGWTVDIIAFIFKGINK